VSLPGDDRQLSVGLETRIAALFGEQAPVVAALLRDRCGANLPMIARQGENGIERVRCAVLKLSEGKMDKLEHAVDRANRDWRDVLVWSGFGNSAFAHKAWLAETASEPRP
jgi:hypothetical protein